MRLRFLHPRFLCCRSVTLHARIQFSFIWLFPHRSSDAPGVDTTRLTDVLVTYLILRGATLYRALRGIIARSFCVYYYYHSPSTALRCVLLD